MRYAVVTTFHNQGLLDYAQKMIDTYCQNWPDEVKLYIYPENCNPVVANKDKVIVRPLELVEDLNRFKTKWKNIPKANGIPPDEIKRKRPRDWRKEFKWNAVRFAHKVYSIFDCSKNVEADILIWMDADMICHSPITLSQIQNLIPADYDLCYLGRQGKFSECGLYAMNLTNKNTVRFLQEFQRVYDDAENGIFLLEEWHDSYVFDQVRKRFPKLRQFNWSSSLPDLRPTQANSPGEGHPLINSQWGAYLDHLKGGRKKLGKSKKEDLKINRQEAYWKNIS